MEAVLMAGSDSSTLMDRLRLGGDCLLVAVDGGADTLRRCGLRPQLLVGDMDSISPGTVAAYRQDGIEVVTLPVHKDETDIEFALRLVATRADGRISVYGALGGPRLDHLLAAVFLLSVPWLRGRDVRLLDSHHEIFMAHGWARLEGRPGDLVSLLPLSREVEEVVTEGLIYPLTGETLQRGMGRGVSNVMLSDSAEVRHGKGKLLIIRYWEEEK